MIRLIFCLCLLVPEPPARVAPPEVRPACFPLCLAANWRTEYYIDGEEVEKEDALARWGDLKLIEVQHSSGGWIQFLRFETKK